MKTHDCKPVTEVIVSYQSAHTIERALAAARRCHEAGLMDLVVVDNGSTDGTVEILRREGNWVHLIETGANNGFGRGCNIGFAQVKTPYTIFVNPDAVLEPDALKTMLDFMTRQPRAGIVGPAIIEEGVTGATELQVTGSRLTPAGMVRCALPFIGDRWPYMPVVPGADAVKVGWVCGAVLMIRTPLFKQLNGFDPHFFLYWEEVDLCKRAEDAGVEIWAVGEATACHVGGGSTASSSSDRVKGCIPKHYFQSRYYYMAKHHGHGAAMVAELVEFVLLSARALADAIRGRGLYRLRLRMQARLLSKPDWETDGH